LVGIALAATGASSALASPAERYEDAVSAYQKNDFDRSLKTLKPLAEKGDARAQYMLGRHYQFGQGVKADKAEAYYWYKRAEGRGHLEAKLFRQLLEKRWKLSADEKARGDRKLAEANAPKTKPEKPKVETARATPPRDDDRPLVTSRPSEPPPVEPPPIERARNAVPERPPAKPPAAAPTKSPAETARFTPPAERNEPVRAPARPPVTDDDDGNTRTADVRTHRPGPPPAETRAALPPTHDGPAAEIDAPYDPAPGYTPPTYAPRNATPNYAAPGYTPPGYVRPAYPPSNYAAYTPPPYYAPGAPPSWRPPYYAPPVYQGPRPGWGYAPRAYWRGGWRGNAWGPGPGYGFRRYRGY